MTTLIFYELTYSLCQPYRWEEGGLFFNTEPFSLQINVSNFPWKKKIQKKTCLATGMSFQNYLNYNEHLLTDYHLPSGDEVIPKAWAIGAVVEW